MVIGQPLPDVLANRAALTHVVSNLLGDAVKFVKKGEQPEVKIYVNAESSNSILIWFKEYGIGIRPEAQERIFLMFQRLNTPADYQGTGIGLTIARKAMERTGGQVGVISVQKRRQILDSFEKTASCCARLTGVSPPVIFYPMWPFQRCEHVLLVEDDENDAFFFERALKMAKAGTSLSHSPDGDDAIEYLVWGFITIVKTPHAFAAGH